MGRQRRRHGFGLALGLCITLLTAACSQPAESGKSNTGEAPRISIATGTTAGIYYPMGGSMAEVINRKAKGVEASAETTGGSVQNLRLIAGGQSDMAIAQSDVVHQAYHGQGEFSGKPVKTQTLMVLYPNVYHAVSLQSRHDDLGLDCFGDIKGKRFSVGAPGSGNELATNLVFDALGMSPDKDIERQRYAYSETARALRDGQIDAGSWVVGEGHGSLRELEATDALHLIPMCDDEATEVTEKYPFYNKHTIKGGVYSTVKKDVPTLALWNVVAVPTDMSEERGYELARALYENVATLNKVYEAGAKYLVLENLTKSPVPLHPGVIRYAEEKGVEIPDRLRP
ncbi:TAXI family TRAP transporter solute-binding subunit [Streptomyces sp. MUM 178J]|uniref:TAXI family TRAP transporter solute-binding subunit n=1 Tax=Streptomyces sp. MUM 178J TaxID=2791991 RepID=UPI001F04E226|nr:TAXI family TRAP transporter solute-binding subunit [Streptomyces sp. MUM 178J]WRQ78248.1 TAXI family TRAP transporter solute-binding subunit [Streptomyces sp. MUM 178J]